MKTTMSFQPTANPRRTTLNSLDGIQLVPAQADEDSQPRLLPTTTANPRRTVLMEVPGHTAPAL